MFYFDKIILSFLLSSIIFIYNGFEFWLIFYSFYDNYFVTKNIFSLLGFYYAITSIILNAFYEIFIIIYDKNNNLNTWKLIYNIYDKTLNFLNIILIISFIFFMADNFWFHNIIVFTYFLINILYIVSTID